MTRYVYTLVFSCLLPFIFLKLWLRGRKLNAYRQRWAERLGQFDTPHFDKSVVWIHSVSVGEFIASKPLIERLLKRGDLEVVVTTMTPTGSERVTETFGDRVFHVYLPYDIPIFCKRFLTKIKPQLALIMETELWPNIINACSQQKIPVVIANARLSEKSARGYQKLSWLTKPMLRNLHTVAAQNKTDAQRFIQLGLPESKCEVIGSIKFDIDVNDVLKQQAITLKQAMSNDGHRPIFIAASTHKGEDEIILRAYKQILSEHSNCLLILVPRHPERFDDVFNLCMANGYTCSRRSKKEALTSSTQILLGDTMGELMLLFGASDIAFIGGSFVENGGHNYIEPSVWGLPVFSGPSVYNFAEIASLLTQKGGMAIVDDAQSLAIRVSALLHDSEGLRAQGNAAMRVAHQNRGALNKLLGIAERSLLS